MTTRGRLGSMDRRTGVVFDHALNTIEAFDDATMRRDYISALRRQNAGHLRRRKSVARDATPVDMAAHVKGWNRLP